MPRIYLDNAATSWPKPAGVYVAVDRFQRELGASPGRGAYRTAIAAGRIVENARRNLAMLLGVRDSRRLIFTANATAALNLAIHGLLRPGDHVVSTVCEHNSVLRPMAEARRRLGVETTFVGCNGAGVVDPDDVTRAIRPQTRLVAVTHGSNVTGAIQPVAAIAAAARERGVLTLVDSAQTLGHIPVNGGELGVDLVAASGHKGLLGPLGTGLLFVGEGVQSQLAPLVQGGTGTESQLDRQPDELPHRYEAGTLNAAALAGLDAAVDFLRERGVAAIAEHERILAARLIAGLHEIPAVRVYGPDASAERVGVVSFTAEGYDPQELAAALDASAGVECRAGLHCAPRMHEALGTLAGGGLVRLSPGWATTEAEIDEALRAIAAVVGM